MPRFEVLAPHHILQDFESGNGDLDGWLKDAAMTANRSGTARVYVWCDDAVVLGYFALAPHTVHRVQVPPRIGRGSPHEIPGYLLARLAIGAPLHGQGHGGELLAVAITTMLDGVQVAGGRILVVDAINDDAISFYEHHGFKALPDNPDRLFLKASSAAASLGIAWP